MSAPSPIVTNVPTVSLSGDPRSAPEAGHPSPRASVQNVPPYSSSSSDSRLADLLDNTARQRDELRRELDNMRARAEAAERALANLRSISDSVTSPGSSITANIISEYEERVQHAERARDRAEIRNRRLVDGWSELDGYLHAVEIRCAEARAQFSRSLHDGGGPLVFPSLLAPPSSLSEASPHSGRRINGPPYVQEPRLCDTQPMHSKRPRSSTIPPPTFSSLPPPQPFSPMDPNRRVRPRTDSFEAGHPYHTPSDQPPSKKIRNEHSARSSRSFYPESQTSHSNPYPSHQPPLQRPSDSARSHDNLAQHRPQSHPSSSRTGNPEAHRRHHVRSHSRSSSSGSISLDEMLIQATVEERGDPNAPPGRLLHLQPPLQPPGNGLDPAIRMEHLPPPPLRQPDRSNPAIDELSHHEHQPRTSTRPPSLNPSPRPIADPPQGPPDDQMRPQMASYQTHTFAPVVTGAPSDRPKPRSRSTADILSPAAPAPSYPRTNAEGQRICRQCGVAGRYKDGKCVEKWGPGPHGPGTVCDRCRKKMKRIERRETIESQQHQQFAATLATQRTMGSLSSSSFISHSPRNSSSYQSLPHDRSLQRTDTLPVPYPHPNRRGPSGDVSSTTSPRSRLHSSFVSPTQEREREDPERRSTHTIPGSPPPSIAVLNEDIRDSGGRIRSNTYPTHGPSRHPSRPGSAIDERHLRHPHSNSVPHHDARISRSGNHHHHRRHKSPSSTAENAEHVVDTEDADADADADPDMDADGEGEKDIDDAFLLEAVEAAEAKISGSPSQDSPSAQEE